MISTTAIVIATAISLVPVADTRSSNRSSRVPGVALTFKNADVRDSKDRFSVKVAAISLMTDIIPDTVEGSIGIGVITSLDARMHGTIGDGLSLRSRWQGGSFAFTAGASVVIAQIGTYSAEVFGDFLALGPGTMLEPRQLSINTNNAETDITDLAGKHARLEASWKQLEFGIRQTVQTMQIFDVPVYIEAVLGAVRRTAFARLKLDSDGKALVKALGYRYKDLDRESTSIVTLPMAGLGIKFGGDLYSFHMGPSAHLAGDDPVYGFTATLELRFDRVLRASATSSRTTSDTD